MREREKAPSYLAFFAARRCCGKTAQSEIWRRRFRPRRRSGKGVARGINPAPTFRRHAGDMPPDEFALPEATRARVRTIADALARERGSADRVALADLRRHVSDPRGRLVRLFADWQAVSLAASEPTVSPAPAAPRRGRRRKPAPFYNTRDDPIEAGPEVSMIAAARQEAEAVRSRRLAKRPGRRFVGLARPARDSRQPLNAADLTTAAGRLQAALDGTARPGAPPRRRVRPADWEGAANADRARAVAVFLCDHGPARSRELCARCLFLNPELSQKAARALLAEALAGSKIVMTGGTWWFEGEEKRPVAGDTFEELFWAAALETLCDAAGREMSAPEIEAAHKDAHLVVRKGWLADKLRRAARFAEGRSGSGANKRPTNKKGTAADAAIPEDGGIEKVGEAYRWAGPGRS